MEYTKGHGIIGMEPCGCRIISHPDPNMNPFIDYCSKHKSAPDLYEACLTALGVMATLDQDKGWVKEISGVIQKAIAKAEGKT